MLWIESIELKLIDYSRYLVLISRFILLKKMFLFISIFIPIWRNLWKLISSDLYRDLHLTSSGDVHWTLSIMHYEKKKYLQSLSF